MESVDLLRALQAVLGLPPKPGHLVSFDDVRAARWRSGPGGGWLQGIRRTHTLPPDSLLGIDRARELLDRNTRQFVRGQPANDALLWGGRGTGKSSLVKAMLHRYGPEGLRLVELGREGLAQLPDVLESLREADPEERFRFILFCDDLSFEADEPAYKGLKSVLDGGLEARPGNVLIYATSNRRHLMPRFFSENQEYERRGEEIIPGESAEEKLSLSDRFGLWIGFYPFDQDAYLAIVDHYLQDRLPATITLEDMHAEALRWALARGSRSGRVARHFANDVLGRIGLNPSGESNENG